MYTRQQAFDIVKKHLLGQKVRSLTTSDSKERCLYRANNGCKCAIGVLIPDNRYQESMDRQGATVGFKFDREFVIHFKLGDLFDIRDIFFFQDLQRLHDSQSINWDGALAEFARKYRIRNTQFK